MTINSYSTLKTAIQEWMDRTDISGNAADFITLAEANFNRELDFVETDVTLTGVIGSRSITVSSYDYLETIGLYLVDSVDSQEYEILPAADGYFPNSSTNARPQFYAIDATTIDFDCPLDQAYSFRWHYKGKFALSDAAPSNQLLEDHPDIYLAGSIVWGGLFVGDDAAVQKYATVLDRYMQAAKHTIARNKRGRVVVDNALTNRRGMGWQW